MTTNGSGTATRPDFGIALGVGRREPLARIGEVARVAEGLGFRSLWIQDNPLSTKDAYMALLMAAHQTERIVLGPGVSNPVIRHPAVIVNSILALDQETDGRAMLGLGSGGAALLAPLGINPRRAREFREELLQIKTLLAGEEVTGPGGLGFRLRKPEHPVPIYVAADGPLMLRAAAELADGVLLGGPALASHFAERIELLRKAAVSVDRDPSSLRIHFLLNVALDFGEQRGVDAAKPFVASWLQTGTVRVGREVPEEFDSVVQAVQAHHDPGSHLSAASTEAQLIPDELARLLTVAGTEEECLDRLQELLSLSPDEIVVTLPSQQRLDRLHALARLAFRVGSPA